MNEYNKELCEERHANIKEGFDRTFKKMSGLNDKLGKLGNKLTGFLFAIIITLLGVIFNILLTISNGGGK